jgi:hypothetical protein
MARVVSGLLVTIRIFPPLSLQDFSQQPIEVSV